MQIKNLYLYIRFRSTGTTDMQSNWMQKGLNDKIYTESYLCRECNRAGIKNKLHSQGRCDIEIDLLFVALIDE